MFLVLLSNTYITFLNRVQGGSETEYPIRGRTMKATVLALMILTIYNTKNGKTPNTPLINLEYRALKSVPQ